MSLPWSRLGPGTPVVLQEEGVRDAELWRGTVCAKDSSAIDIALNALPEPQADRALWCLQISSDESLSPATATRCLKDGDEGRTRSASATTGCFISRATAAVCAAGAWQPLDKNLNPVQQAAIDHALAAEDIAIVHGPPGTGGKTRTIVELIRQQLPAVKMFSRVRSNLAVDNLVERLAAAGERVVRLGHPARVLPHLQSLTLDVLVEEHPDVAVAKAA